MEIKVSFDEIIKENLIGIWCEGLALIEVTDDEIKIKNIYNNNRKNLAIDEYPISRKDKVFSKVTELNYNEAIQQFTVNKKNMISPNVISDEIQTFEGMKWIEYGGNVYCHTKDNKVIVNDKDRFESLDEVEQTGFISEKEKKGKWLVF